MTAVREDHVRSISALIGDATIDVTRNTVITIRRAVATIRQFQVITGVLGQVA